MKTNYTYDTVTLVYITHCDIIISLELNLAWSEKVEGIV